jgi:16S rRNA (cytosine1402-N4)-methyltransferase
VESKWQHTTVLLNEAVTALFTKPDSTYVDATFGRGGHSRLLLSKLGAQGRLIAYDKDLDAIAEAGRIDDPRFSIRHEGFAHLGELPTASAAGVLMDLGVSSPQIDNPARGFSFRGTDWRPREQRSDSRASVRCSNPKRQSRGWGCPFPWPCW